MWFGNWYDFYIVQKEVEADDTDVEADAAGAKPVLNRVSNEDSTPSISQSSWKTPPVSFEGKHNSSINVINEHENRKLGAIQGV